MRYLKTYGAKGLLELKMMLTAGKAKVKINFTGGSMGGNGVISAKYTTDNPAVQRLIESSRHFQCVKVFLHGKPLEIKEVTAAHAAEARVNPQTCNDNESEYRRPVTESGPDAGGEPCGYDC